jgi:hypothetical protein
MHTVVRMQTYSEKEQEEMAMLTRELRAVVYWDREYLRNRKPSLNESIAWANRQDRRSEIVSQLCNMVLREKKRRLPRTTAGNAYFPFVVPSKGQ